MTSAVIYIVVLVAASCSIARGQLPIATTIPLTTDDNPTIISEPVNATNTSIFCQLERNNQIAQTRWSIQRPGDSTPTEILIDVDVLLGIPGFENYFVERRMVMGGVLRSNLTIRVFENSLDMANISCFSGVIQDTAINGTFTLRVISEDRLLSCNLVTDDAVFFPQSHQC